MNMEDKYLIINLLKRLLIEIRSVEPNDMIIDSIKDVLIYIGEGIQFEDIEERE
jgi:hypothetical protein